MYRVLEGKEVYRSRIGFAVDQIFGNIGDRFSGRTSSGNRTLDYIGVISGLLSSPFLVPAVYVASFKFLEKADSNQFLPPTSNI